jgi:hypothetical protein
MVFFLFFSATVKINSIIPPKSAGLLADQSPINSLIINFQLLLSTAGWQSEGDSRFFAVRTDGDSPK